MQSEHEEFEDFDPHLLNSYKDFLENVSVFDNGNNETKQIRT